MNEKNKPVVDISNVCLFSKGARQEFYENLNLLQKKISMHIFRKDSTNAFKKNSYMSLDGILKELMPLICSADFSFQFVSLEEKSSPLCANSAERGKQKLYTLSATLTYKNGYSENYKIDVPLPEKIANATQRMGMLATYGKRYLVSMVFCIAVEDDTDGEFKERVSKNDKNVSLAKTNRVIARNKGDNNSYPPPKMQSWITNDEAQKIFELKEQYKLEINSSEVLEELEKVKKNKNLSQVRAVVKHMEKELLEGKAIAMVWG